MKESNKPQILWAYQTKVSSQYSTKYYNGEVIPNSLWPNHSVFLDDLKHFYFEPVLIHYLDAVKQSNPFVFAISLRHFIGGHSLNLQQTVKQLAGFDWIPEEILQACRQNQCTLYFEDPFEGYPDWDGTQVYLLVAIAERLNIPSSCIILSTGNARLPERAKAYDANVSVVYEDYFRFEFYTRKNKSARPFYDHRQEQKTHIFLNYNRHWNHNRQYFVYSLWKNDLLKYGLVSLAEATDNQQRIQIKNPMYWDKWFSSPKEMATAAEDAETFMSILPLLIDVDLKENMAHLLNEDHYLQTYVSVVSETWGFNSTAFFSEKIYKAILAEHPFIVLSSQGFLQYLRQQGFKTFDGIIDESYDLEESESIRKDLILKEIQKIASKSKEELQDFLETTREITAFNRKVLETNSNYGKQVYECWSNKYKFNGD